VHIHVQVPGFSAFCPVCRLFPGQRRVRNDSAAHAVFSPFFLNKIINITATGTECPEKIWVVFAGYSTDRHKKRPA
jgi:hypothetical protein